MFTILQGVSVRTKQCCDAELSFFQEPESGKMTGKDPATYCGSDWIRNTENAGGYRLMPGCLLHVHCIVHSRYRYSIERVCVFLLMTEPAIHGTEIDGGGVCVIVNITSIKRNY